MATFDSVLQWLIPALLVVIIAGFAWVKFIQPFVVPMFIKMYNYFKGKPHEESNKSKEIVFE